MPEDVFLLKFSPEDWTQTHKLLHFHNLTLGKSGHIRIGLRDCESHLSKVEVLWRVASKLRPNLVIDNEELEKFGGTSGLNSSELASIYEAIICALYSALDGLRTFIYGQYQRVQGVQNKSNGRLFDRARDMEYGVGFPEEVRLPLADAADSWFKELRKIRTELTHGSTGGCHWREKTDTVFYMNTGMTVNGKSYIQEDVEGFLQSVEFNVRELVEKIAGFHLSRIERKPVFQICGIYRGLLYTRAVEISPEMSSADGQCLSYEWFEREGAQSCPLSSRCPAYQRKFPGGQQGLAKLESEREAAIKRLSGE